MKIFKKTDEDVLDFDIDVSNWLIEGDTVDDATVVYPKDAENNSEIDYRGKTLFDDRVKLWIGGGVAGQQYPFKVLVITEAGRTKEVNFILVVTEI